MNLIYKIVEFLNKIRTAYRRINRPEIKWGDLVIDIGSGGVPNPRADIVCDFIEENTERGDILKIDRPFVWANIENLPFKDKVFDYSIVSHVLEHVEKPEDALLEIQRISKAGYIETPNAFYEYAIPHVFHVSRCTVINNKLIIFMKNQLDETVPKEYFDIHHDMNKCWWDLHKLNALALLTIYKWKDKINFEIYGDASCKKATESINKNQILKDKRCLLKKIIIKFVYLLMKPRKRIEWQKILACPKCKGDLIIDSKLSYAQCNYCSIKFKKYKEFLDFRLP